MLLPNRRSCGRPGPVAVLMFAVATGIGLVPGYGADTQPFVLAVAQATLEAVVPGPLPVANKPGPKDSTNAAIGALWADFNHYVLIARPDLARDSGQKLLKTAVQSELLDAVEASDYRDPAQMFDRAERVETVRDVARQLRDRIQAARIERSREPERIRADIQLLAEGQRPYRNAVARLRAAGQYAAPLLLETLGDQRQSKLHPYVLQAMVAVGRPLVYPLAEALLELDAVPLGQVAQVLAEIGYPLPLPYLKQVIEDNATDPTARRIVEAAYRQILERSSLPTDLNAAELFLLLGQRQYSSTTRGQELIGFDAAQDKGLVWAYPPRTGLVPIAVCAQIFGDVLAMRSARRALSLDEEIDQALSLYLMANLRRENRLPDGQVDPSYPSDMHPALFYAMLAGPLRLHDVLSQALRDADVALALDAIDALSRTSGTDALINRGAATQPLLRALSFPNRRVRFRAAEALAAARPQETFPGSYRVVPVLAEAVRQRDKLYALVLADDPEVLNDLRATLDELGYEAFGGRSLTEVDDEVRARPGVDLIVVSLSASAIGEVLRATTNDYRLGALPVVAVTSLAQQIRLHELFADESRLTPVVASAESDQMTAAIEHALSTYAGDPIGADEGADMALTALWLFADLALNSNVYRVTDAQPALIDALSDHREEIVTEAGMVLALLDNAQAQTAVADAALTGSGEVQVSLLNNLAASATHFGNLISQSQTDTLLELVRTGGGEVAIAAAQAHGALTLPTSNAVKLIVK